MLSYGCGGLFFFIDQMIVGDRMQCKHLPKMIAGCPSTLTIYWHQLFPARGTHPYVWAGPVISCKYMGFIYINCLLNCLTYSKLHVQDSANTVHQELFLFLFKIGPVDIPDLPGKTKLEAKVCS